MSPFRCPQCEADPQPADCVDPRNCAFDEAGTFTPDNWNCATIVELCAGLSDDDEHHGDNESMQIIPVRFHDWTRGWIVLTRYKHRGRTSSAMHVGDFWPAVPLTYALATRVLAARAHGQKGGRPRKAETREP